MRISEIARALALIAASTAAGSARASDDLGQGSGTAEGLLTLVQGEAYASVKDALRLGVRDYNAGDKAGAVRALEYAAAQGHALALWKLGRMYADGDGVAQDDLRAFEYFSRIADENADETPGSSRSGIVSAAFVALGSYLLDGIKGSHVAPNPARSAELYQYAASFFGDSNAQFGLARLYLDGTGVDRDPRQAARWFNLAAEKGHHPAQALLGQLLWNGEGVPRQPARGLMWLRIASEGCDRKRDAWIPPLYDQVMREASEVDRRTAIASAEQFQSRRR